MKFRYLLMAVGLIFSAWLAFFADKTPDINVAEPVLRTKPVHAKQAVGGSPLLVATQDKSRKNESGIFILALQSRKDLADGSNQIPSDQLFKNQTWAPPPPPPPKPLPPPPPSAPAVPFVYLGKKYDDGEWQVFLSRGEATYVVGANTVIDDTYRVDSITPSVLSLTYLPLKQKQTLAIGRTD